MANWHSTRRHPNFKDITGQRFSQLLVLRLVCVNMKHSFWLCKCDCGEPTVVTANNLKAGRSKSCGCFRRQALITRNTTHGLCHKRIYKVYMGMIARCHRQGHKQFRDYGGRGIYVCERWRDDIRNFAEDIGPCPSDRHSIERINNDGPYCKENCCWATPDVQAQNRRSTVNITHNGRTQCVSNWAKELGINKGTIYSRLQSGWSTEQTLTPIQPSGNHQSQRSQILSNASLDSSVSHRNKSGRTQV